MKINDKSRTRIATAMTVSIDLAAEILHVSRRTIYNRIKDGSLRTISARGGSQRVTVESLISAPLGSERKPVSPVEAASLRAHPLSTLDRYVREAKQSNVMSSLVRRLIGADGATFIRREGTVCYYFEEDAISVLWKGRRFPITACVSGWVMEHRESVTIPDIYADQRVPHDAYRPTFVKSLAMVPVGNGVAALGAYWAAAHVATRTEMTLLKSLADSFTQV